MKNPFISQRMSLMQRMNLLEQMDTYLRHSVQDNVVDIWFASGLPDGWEECDLYDIAEDEYLWLDAVKTFYRCCKLDNEI